MNVVGFGPWDLQHFLQWDPEDACQLVSILVRYVSAFSYRQDESWPGKWIRIWHLRECACHETYWREMYPLQWLPDWHHEAHPPAFASAPFPFEFPCPHAGNLRRFGKHGDSPLCSQGGAEIMALSVNKDTVIYIVGFCRESFCRIYSGSSAFRTISRSIGWTQVSMYWLVYWQNSGELSRIFRIFKQRLDSGV